jgi:hypothetical protein
MPHEEGIYSAKTSRTGSPCGAVCFYERRFEFALLLYVFTRGKPRIRVTFALQMKRFTRTKKELAELIGISRPTLDRLFRYPNPGMLEDGRHYDVREWQRFAATNVCYWQIRK